MEKRVLHLPILLLSSTEDPDRLGILLVRLLRKGNPARILDSTRVVEGHVRGNVLETCRNEHDCVLGNRLHRVQHRVRTLATLQLLPGNAGQDSVDCRPRTIVSNVCLDNILESLNDFWIVIKIERDVVIVLLPAPDQIGRESRCLKEVQRHIVPTL